MAGRVLLDTNIVVALLTGDAGVHDRLAGVAEVFIPTVALGELYYGARNSGRVRENLARLDQFAKASTVLACDESIAQEYGAIKHALRLKGRPLPENDIWIAAIARRHALTLITRDSHFEHIEPLNLERW